MTTSALASLFVFALVLRQVGLLDDASQTSVGVALGSTIVSGFVLVPTLCGFHISRFIGSTSASPLLAGGLAHNDTAPRDGVSLGKMQDDTWNIIAGVVAGGQAQNGAPASTNALDSGVCAVDEAGLVLFMNDRFKALALIEDITPVGNPLGKVASSSDLIKYIAQLVASTDPTADFVEEIRVSGRQDKAKFLEIHLMPHDGQSGPHEESQEMTGSPRVIRLTDITAKRTIDERLSRIQRNKALSACARSAAPHLSELFTSILGRASHALHVGQPSAFAGALQSIQILAAQGGNIVQQLNELTIPPEAATRRTVNLKTTIQERLAILQGLVGEKIEIQIQATSGELNARVDTALLTQAITLVVMNAAEAYSDGAGRVSISMGPEEIDELVCKLHPGSRPGNFCRISISDYGRGMSPEVLARVANPLLTQRGEFGHIGLDLPSVLAVMSDHDGFMTVESKPDRGTTVSLYFPVAKMSPQIDQPAEARNGAHRQATSANHDSTRVLIVEDRPELRALLQEMVKSLGYRSTTCSSKDDALKLMQAAPVDILLVEEALPGLSAHELVTEAHARDSHVKTVLLSSSQNKADEESDAVLVKPFDLQTLAKTLEESEMSLH